MATSNYKRYSAGHLLRCDSRPSRSCTSVHSRLGHQIDASYLLPQNTFYFTGKAKNRVALHLARSDTTTSYNRGHRIDTCSCRIPFTLQARQKIASPCTLPVLTQQHLTIEDIESIPAPADFPVTLESNPNRSLGFGAKLSSRKITTPLNILRPLHKKKPTLRIVTRASHLKFPAKIEASIRFRPQHSF